MRFQNGEFSVKLNGDENHPKLSGRLNTFNIFQKMFKNSGRKI